MTYRLRRGTMPALPRPEARYSSVGVVHAGHGITAGHRPRDRAGGAAGALGDASEGAGNLLAFRSPTPPPVTPGSTVNDNDQLLFGRDQSGQLGQIWWRADGTPSVYKSPDPVNAPQVQFDPDQHLLSGIGTASHGYRGDGLRAWREANGQRTWYVYDGVTPICELDTDGNLATSRTYGLTGPVARGGVYYLFDLLGDVAVRHTLGNDELSADVYDAWGVRLAGAEDVWGYRGQAGYEWDAETGLYLLTWRWYDPATGRFVTRDPISYAGGLNLYADCGGDPVGLLDPLRLCEPVATALVVAVCAAAGGLWAGGASVLSATGLSVGKQVGASAVIVAVLGGTGQAVVNRFEDSQGSVPSAALCGAGANAVGQSVGCALEKSIGGPLLRSMKANTDPVTGMPESVGWHNITEGLAMNSGERWAAPAWHRAVPYAASNTVSNWPQPAGLGAATPVAAAPQAGTDQRSLDPRLGPNYHPWSPVHQ